MTILVRTLRNTIVAIILLLSVAGGQPDTRNTSSHFLGIRTEAGLVSFRDDLLVPLAFTGPGFAFGGSYAYLDGDNRIDADLSFRLAYTLNRFSHEAASLSGRMRSAWVTRIDAGAAIGDIWLGASLPFRINDMFLFSWDDAHVYWVTSYGAGPTASWQTSLTEGRTVRASIDLPLVHVVSRPPVYRYNKQDAMNRFSFWFSEPNTSLRLEPIGTYTAVTVSGAIEWMSEGTFSSLGLEMRFARLDGDKPAQDLNTMVTYSYRWGL